MSNNLDVKVEEVETEVLTPEAPTEDTPAKKKARGNTEEASKKASKGKTKTYTVQVEKLAYNKVYKKGDKIELEEEELKNLGNGWVK